MKTLKLSLATIFCLLALALAATPPAGAATGFAYSFSFNAPEGGFSNALAAAVDQSNGAVYVSDFGTELLWKLKVNLEGRTVAPELFGTNGHVGVPGLAFQPAVDNYLGGEGDVFVPVLGTGAVMKLAPNGEVLTLATPISGLGEPTGVAVDTSGNIYVAQLGGAVVKFNATGKPVNAAGVETTENTLLTAPSQVRAIAINPTGTDIYLATETGAIQYVLSGGKYVQDITLGSEYTLGVAIAPASSPAAGDVFVESGGEISEWEPGRDELLRRFGQGYLAGRAARLAVYGTALGTVVYAPNEGSGVAVFAEGPSPEPPETLPPTEITGHSAIFHGKLKPPATKLGYYFEYNMGASCGGSTRTPVKEGEGEVEEEITQLEPGTEYSVCMVTVNQYGEAFGAKRSLTTLKVAPVVDEVPLSSSSVSGTEATLAGVVNPENEATSYYFAYGVANVSEHKTQSLSAGSGYGGVPVSVSLTGLEPSETYHYELVATNGSGPASSEATFNTLPAPPSVNVAESSQRTPFSVTLNGTVDSGGDTSPLDATTYCFEYGTNTSYNLGFVPSSGAVDVGGGTNPIAVSAALTGLTPNTTYHYRLVAVNSIESGLILPSELCHLTTGQSAASADQILTTPPATTPPTVETSLPEGVTENTAVLSGAVDPRGFETSYQFQVGVDTSYGADVFGSVGAGEEPVKVTLDLVGLAPGTTYHYRLVGISDAGTTYGPDESFTTAVYPSAFIAIPASFPLIPTPAFSPPSIVGAITPGETIKPSKKHPAKNGKGKKKKGKKDHKASRSVRRGRGL